MTSLFLFFLFFPLFFADILSFCPTLHLMRKALCLVDLFGFFFEGGSTTDTFVS